MYFRVCFILRSYYPHFTDKLREAEGTQISDLSRSRCVLTPADVQLFFPALSGSLCNLSAFTFRTRDFLAWIRVFESNGEKTKILLSRFGFYSSNNKVQRNVIVVPEGESS